jgi:hypothetical protein
MKTGFKAFLALLLMACGAAAYADPPSRVARLNHVAGPVSLAPADAPESWTQAMLNRPLTTGDRLWADDSGRAELHVGSTAIRLSAFTSLDFLNLDDSAVQMRLAQGALNLRVRDLAQGEIVEIATPSGAVLVRQPGSYRITTDPQSDTTRIAVTFGQAEVVTPVQTVTVPSGQTAVISRQSGIAFEVAAFAAADEFDRWSADRDRREDRVTATRYVSREMTGYEDLDQYGTWRTLPEYGAVWVPARVASGWAPYRHGHWAWVSPWGWTWIDDAPWGFAPSHYGRWIWTGGYWAWTPGAVVRRPVYAPALVAFVGGSHWSASVRSGPAVGWFPLGYREPYRPWYRASETHVRNVNVTNVTNVYNTTNVRYVNRANPQAVTVVPQQAFVSARPVAASSVQVAPAELARAEVLHAAPPAQPGRTSLAHDRAGRRPPSQTLAREVVAVNAPAPSAAQATLAPQDAASSVTPRRAEQEPRVRVIGRERGDARAERFRSQPEQTAPAAATAPQAAPPAAAGRAAPATTAAPAPTAAPVAPAAPAISAAPAAASPTTAPAVPPAPAAASATTSPAAPASAPAPVARPVALPTASAPSATAPAARAAATPAATTAPAAVAPAATPSGAVAQPPSAQPYRRYGAEERRSAPREAAAPQASPPTATFSSTPAPSAPAQPSRLEQRAPAQAEQRAAPREQYRQERAAARAEERPARAAPAPEARPPARAEERRPAGAEEAPRARPPAPQAVQGAAPAASPQREARVERAAPAPAARAAEPQRAAPEHRRAQPAPQ